MPTRPSCARSWPSTRERTGSEVAQRLLADWEASLERFVKVMPDDYRRVLDAAAERAGELAEVG